MKDNEGKKWACEACIKGHRVSGCNHADRPLKEIAPKGRPVKQCEHCRVARRSKSHHAKCDCGDKKEKTKTPKVDAQGCCCHHGAKCICGLKVDTLDPISETQPLKLPNRSVKTRPGISAAQSESTLTVFANGHHKPCHRLNNLAHTSGAPYKIPRPHSLHASHTSQNINNLEQTERMRREAHSSFQRSMDDLLLSNTSTNNNPYGYFDNTQGSTDSLPISPLNGIYDADFGSFDLPKAFSNPSQNSISIECDDNSLGRTLSRDSINSQPWLWIDPATTASASQYGLESLPTSPTADLFPGNDSEWAIPSAGIDHFFGPADLPLNPDQLSGTFAQPISHSGESNHYSAPGLTGSSSGAQSEVGETGGFGDLDTLHQRHTSPEAFTGDQNFPLGEVLPYRYSTTPLNAELSRLQSPVADMDNRRSLDLNLLRRPSDDFLLASGLPFDGLSQSLHEPFRGILPSSTRNSSPQHNSIPAPLQRATTYSDFRPSQIFASPNFSSAPSTSEPRSITIPADPIENRDDWFPNLGLDYIGQNPYQAQDDPSWL